MKERLEEEMKNAQKMEEQRLKRCQKKKEWDDQRKKEEAEQKRLEEENLRVSTDQALAAVSPEGTPEDRPYLMETTAILSELNQGQTEPDEPDDLVPSLRWGG